MVCWNHPLVVVIYQIRFFAVWIYSSIAFLFAETNLEVNGLDLVAVLIGEIKSFCMLNPTLNQFIEVFYTTFSQLSIGF